MPRCPPLATPLGVGCSGALRWSTISTPHRIPCGPLWEDQGEAGHRVLVPSLPLPSSLGLSYLLFKIGVNIPASQGTENCHVFFHLPNIL